jgi:hypothetical protein
MIRRLWQKLKHRIGRRGAFLGFLAVLDLCYGYSLLTTPPVLKYDLLLPWWAWGVIWLAVGAFALSGMFFRKDWPQYTVCAVLKAAWAALSAHLWLIQHLPRGWVSVVIWAAFSVTVVLVGGWPECENDLPPVELP